jgi:hypothetical protein
VTVKPENTAEITSSSEPLSVVPSDDVAHTDVWTVRLVVIALTAVVVMVIVGQIVLTLKDHTMPDELLVLGGVAVGALGSLLARTSSVSGK